MEKNILISEIIEFCYKYKLINKDVNIDEIKKNIGINLKDCAFVESLIKTMMDKTRYHKSRDNEKIKELIKKLEDLKLELE